MKQIKFTIFPIVLFSLLMTNLYAQIGEDYFLLIGTYTTAPTDGIEVYRYNSKTGKFEFANRTAIQNPSYLAIAPDQKHLYSVSEAGNPNGGSVAAFSFDDRSGILAKINSQPSSGNHPCYVSVHKNGKWVAAGNYSTGNLVYYPVAENGSLGTATMIQHKGSSIVKGRQEGPHLHATVFSPDYKYLMTPDLGLDKVMIYKLNSKGSIITENPGFVALKPGAGPRHLDFHPKKKYAYLMEEMSGNVTALSYKRGKLAVIQTINGHPADFKGTVGSADIHVSPDGKFVYCSNRGESNSIGIFKVNKSDGTLTLAGHQSTLGKTPRNFSIDPTGNYLLVANQNTNDVVIFKRDKMTGLLTDTGDRLTVNKPVCLKWAKKGNVI
ncbi:MAG: lactonase family protein [Saprospiraceae bacterium]|nr:lactonase family protein [Saprospiraceae bacterium]